MTKSAAYQAGYERGQASGSWVIDGDTSEETARRLLEGIEDGDPQIMDIQPAPLSGEWAGESVSELSDLYGLDLEDEENASDFEEGYSEGFWEEVERSARAILPEPEPETLNAFELARLADVASPDASDSPGAQWLEHVQLVARELVSANPGVDADDLADAISEGADSAVPIYTHERFQVFVDLAAYTEDVTDFGPIEDMEQGAGIALYMVAERLIRALIAEGSQDA